MEHRVRRGGARIPSYDVLRLVATLCVVFIHVSASSLQLEGPAWPWLLSANRHLIRYAVPAFFLITGALVWGRSGGVASSGGYVRFMKRRFTVVVVPYLIWSTAYIIAPLLMGATRSPSQVLVGLLTGETWYHLYFVPAIMVVYALTPLVERVVRISPELLLLIALAVHLTVPLTFNGSVPFVPGAVERVISSTAIYMPYAALGALIAKRGLERSVLRRGWPVLLAASLFLMSHRTVLLPSDAVLYRSLTAVAALGVLGGALGACSVMADWKPLRQIAESLGPHTYTAYLVHPLLIQAAALITLPSLVSFIWHDRVGLWLTFTVVLAASLAIGWVQSRMLDRYARRPSGSGTVTE